MLAHLYFACGFEYSGMAMRFRVSRRAVKRFLLYGAFPDPFSKRFGDGWFGILLGAATRALPFGVWVGALSCVVAPGALSAGRLIFMTAVFFVYSILLEWHLTRRSDREAEFPSER
jgi:hypothetical protein